MKGKIIRFIRKAGRVIPISEKRVASAINKAKVEAELTKGFAQRERKIIGSDAVLSNMEFKASQKIKKLQNFKMRNDAHRESLKETARKGGTMAALTGLFGGVAASYKTKKKKK